MTPLQRYQHDINTSGFRPDAAQQHAVSELDKLYHSYRAYLIRPVPKLSRIEKLFRKKLPPDVLPRGLYLWGGVGRGKTYLMDTFCAVLPGERVLRMHFHRFMLRVHDELKQLREVTDPLKRVADRFKAECDLLCFDEFFVTDITDAMLLATLLHELFERGIVLVATSNIPPQDLYRNGLQRARFLPAIDLIQNHCQVIHIDSGIDYRLRTLQQAEIYHYPLDARAAENLQCYYAQLSGEVCTSKTAIEINHRQIPVLQAGDGVLFASFSQLCQSARSASDYVEVSRLYHSVLLADVPQMNAELDDAARRFIALVDEFYERNVKLIISAEVAIDRLYIGERLAFEFRRCLSRLVEMQSLDYLEREHLA